MEHAVPKFFEDAIAELLHRDVWWKRRIVCAINTTEKKEQEKKTKTAAPKVASVELSSFKASAATAQTSLKSTPSGYSQQLEALQESLLLEHFSVVAALRRAR